VARGGARRPLAWAGRRLPRATAGQAAWSWSLATEDRRQRCRVCRSWCPTHLRGPLARAARRPGDVHRRPGEASRYAGRALQPLRGEPRRPRTHAQVSVESASKSRRTSSPGTGPSTCWPARPPWRWASTWAPGRHPPAQRPAQAGQLRAAGGRAAAEPGRAGAGLRAGDPHDQYFYDNPAEMIAGAVPAPVFLWATRTPSAGHLHAVACGWPRPACPTAWPTWWTSPDGQAGRPRPGEAGLTAAVEPALEVALSAFGADVLGSRASRRSSCGHSWRRCPRRSRMPSTGPRGRSGSCGQRWSLPPNGRAEARGGPASELISRLLGLDSGDRGGDGASAYPLRRLAEFGFACRLRVSPPTRRPCAAGRRRRVHPVAERPARPACPVPSPTPPSTRAAGAGR